MRTDFFLNLTLSLLIIILPLISCNRGGSISKNHSSDTLKKETLQTVIKRTRLPLSDLEKKFHENGLVDVQELDSTIKVDMKYAGTDNFLKTNIYGNLHRAWLQPDVAIKIINAQKYLKEIHPAFSIIVFDAARPMHLQKLMWDSINIPLREREKYVSNPRHGGSLHNYGAAVDVSVLDSAGKQLDMGCPFDYFGELAYIISEDKLLAAGKLTERQFENRRLLRTVMTKAGFSTIDHEWWHFNSCSREKAMEIYKPIE